jgi:hypothetical protein
LIEANFQAQARPRYFVLIHGKNTVACDRKNTGFVLNNVDFLHHNLLTLFTVELTGYMLA